MLLWLLIFKIWEIKGSRYWPFVSLVNQPNRYIFYLLIIVFSLTAQAKNPSNGIYPSLVPYRCTNVPNKWLFTVKPAELSACRNSNALKNPVKFLSYNLKTFWNRILIMQSLRIISVKTKKKELIFRI